MASDKDMARAYAMANEFIKTMREYQPLMTAQQVRTIKGQALSGDIDGARKGLRRIIERAKP